MTNGATMIHDINTQSHTNHFKTHGVDASILELAAPADGADELSPSSPETAILSSMNSGYMSGRGSPQGACISPS